MRKEDFEGVELTEQSTLDQLLKKKKLYDVVATAKIVGMNPRYIRRLCHAGAIDHHRLLGRYYLTPVEVANLLQPRKGVLALLTAEKK